MDLSASDERAIFAVLDAAVGVAGRTSVVLALRGSRSEKVKRLGLEGAPGHGYFAGRPEADVLACVDTCFHRGWLRVERSREGLPLIAYTEEGLAKAKGYVVDGWLLEVRGQADAVAGGAGLTLSFLMSENPQRNQETVLELVDAVARVADATWLPVLRAWREVETRRVRGRLGAVIGRLEAKA